MKKNIAILSVVLLLAAAHQRADACGYGLFDPDVETACSGDPIQAQLAVDRIIKRGQAAVDPVKRYQTMMLRSHQSHVERLDRLFQRDGSYNLTETQRQTEIERSRNYLEWSADRIRILDVLLIQLIGNNFGGEPRCFNDHIIG